MRRREDSGLRASMSMRSVSGCCDLGRPVAANRKRAGHELCLQQRLGIGAADTRAAVDHFGVAGQFLVNAHGLGADVDQRVEPEQAARPARRCALMRASLRSRWTCSCVRMSLRSTVAEAAGEIVRRHDARLGEADNGGAWRCRYPHRA